MIVVPCSNCAQDLVVKAALAGEYTECRHCGAEVPVSKAAVPPSNTSSARSAARAGKRPAQRLWLLSLLFLSGLALGGGLLVVGFLGPRGGS